MAMLSGDQDGDDYRALADINVTPLVDVLLVLLIVFMITAPLLVEGVDVQLPTASIAKPLEPQKPIVVSIDKAGIIRVGADEVDKAAIAGKIRALSVDGLRPVHVRADMDSAYRDIMGVMDLLAAQGITNIALVTRPPK